MKIDEAHELMIFIILNFVCYFLTIVFWFSLLNIWLSGVVTGVIIMRFVSMVKRGYVKQCQK